MSERELIFPSYVVFTFLANLISKRILFLTKRRPPFESNITSQVRFQNDPLLKTETLFEENMSFVHEIRLLENERVKNVSKKAKSCFVISGGNRDLLILRKIVLKRIFT